MASSLSNYLMLQHCYATCTETPGNYYVKSRYDHRLGEYEGLGPRIFLHRDIKCTLYLTVYSTIIIFRSLLRMLSIFTTVASVESSELSQPYERIITRLYAPLVTIFSFIY